MKTSRIKTIVIAILLLLNLVLATLLLNLNRQERSVYERSTRQLTVLYEKSGVALDPSILPREARLSALEPARDSEAERAFAEMLLGAVSTKDAGGGHIRYYNASGQCLLRAGGAVEASLSRLVGNQEQFCDELFTRFGYEATESSFENGSGAMRGVRRLPGGRVFNAELVLTFSRGRLIAVNGYFVPEPPAEDSAAPQDAVSAMVRFLDYRNEAGEACTAIRSVRCGYLLQSTTSAAQRLVPAWLIETDTNSYYVNIGTGEIDRR